MKPRVMQNQYGGPPPEKRGGKLKRAQSSTYSAVTQSQQQAQELNTNSYSNMITATATSYQAAGPLNSSNGT